MPKRPEATGVLTFEITGAGPRWRLHVLQETTDGPATQDRSARRPVQRRVSTPSRPNPDDEQTAEHDLPPPDLPRRRFRGRKAGWGAVRRAGRVVVSSCEAARRMKALKLRCASGAEADEARAC